MTLLFYYKPIYHPSGVGTNATVKGKTPKKRKKNKRIELKVESAPNFESIYDNEKIKIIHAQEETAKIVQGKIKEKHHRMQEEEILIALLMEEDDNYH